MDQDDNDETKREETNQVKSPEVRAVQALKSPEPSSQDQVDKVEKESSSPQVSCSLEKFKVKVSTKKQTMRKSMIKVKRRRSMSKTSLGKSGSTTSLGSNSSDEDLARKYYHVKAEKVVKTVKVKSKIKVKRKSRKLAASNLSKSSKDKQSSIDDGKFAIEVTSDSDSTSTTSFGSLRVSTDTLYQPFDIEVIEPTAKQSSVDMSKFVSKVADNQRSPSGKNRPSKDNTNNQQSVSGQRSATEANQTGLAANADNEHEQNATFNNMVFTIMLLFVFVSIVMAIIQIKMQ